MNLKTQKLKGMLCGVILIGVVSACGQNQQEQERRTPLDLVNFKELPDPTADTLSDWSKVENHPFSEEDLKDRQSRGLNTTFYIYCGNAFPNQFTFSDPAESVLVAWFAEAANFDGMLRWAFNSWVENPLLDSRFRTWPAGDTYIVYPNARSSIRYERLLEGLQDYAKIQVVKRALENKGDQANLDRLETAIRKLKITKPNQTWNQDLNDAKGLLNELSVQLVQ